MSHEPIQHIDDYIAQTHRAETTTCDGCSMSILRSEVVSPSDWSESYCVLCLSPVPEVL